MNTCGTCKHKTKRDEFEQSEYGDTGYFHCGRIKHNKNSTDCTCYEREPDGFDIYATDKPLEFHDDQCEMVYPKQGKAYTIDGSGYYAALCVADDFGCNLWETNK